MTSLRLPNAPNAGLFKQGYQVQQSEDGAVNRNIAAVREISAMVRTSIGPCGRNKIVVNHLSKIFLTSDAATILRELEVVHPAAKLVVMASQQQDAEMGDATNLVLVLCGELLNRAENLLRLGLSTSEIVQGYELAYKFAAKELDALSVDSVADLHDPKELVKAVNTALCSKQYGNEQVLGELVAQAVSQVLPQQAAQFNVDNVRVVKVLGASLDASHVVQGMVFPQEAEGTVKSLKSRAKIAVFTCPLDISTTETKGTVLLHNAQEMLDFSKGEEKQLEAVVKELADSGLKVVVAGAGVGDLMLHYFNKYNLLVFRVSSKFELRRLCRVVGATPMPRLGAPLPEEMGQIDVVEVLEIGGDRVTVFRQNNESQSQHSRTSTIVLRGATQSALDDLERAVDDGVAVVKALTKDPRLVAGAGAVEIELASRIAAYGERTPGLLQHAIKAYAEAFEVIPRTLAENTGQDAIDVISRLYAEHTKGKTSAGVDIEGESAWIDALARGVFDLLSAKQNALKLATETANTVLSVDQIIMAKRAGGPQVPQQRQQGHWDQDD